ncbi:MAG: hypothetical protein K8E24_015270, partial [Methanobacterium paludis]|nr:hypothetical protein [Methanobacterium paludis]
NLIVNQIQGELKMSQIFPINVSFVDDLDPLIDSKVIFDIKNASDRIEICSNEPDSTHKFIIKDAAKLDIKTSSEYEKRLLSRIFAISCSLACKNVFFFN